MGCQLPPWSGQPPETKKFGASNRRRARISQDVVASGAHTVGRSAGPGAGRSRCATEPPRADPGPARPVRDRRARPAQANGPPNRRSTAGGRGEPGAWRTGSCGGPSPCDRPRGPRAGCRGSGGRSASGQGTGRVEPWSAASRRRVPWHRPANGRNPGLADLPGRSATNVRRRTPDVRASGEADRVGQALGRGQSDQQHRVALGQMQRNALGPDL